MDDFLNLVSAITSGHSRILARDSVSGLTVSTVVTSDQGPETAILDANGTHPVERYQTEEKAVSGHAKWLDKIRTGQREVTKLGYGKSLPSQEITLKPVSDIQQMRRPN